MAELREKIAHDIAALMENHHGTLHGIGDSAREAADLALAIIEDALLRDAALDAMRAIPNRSVAVHHRRMVAAIKAASTGERP